LAAAASAGQAQAGSHVVWRIERGGSAHRLCTPRRVFPRGTSFITVCASADRKHWRPIFSAEPFAYWAFAPTDDAEVPDPNTIAEADFSSVSARLRHPSRLRGSITLGGTIGWNSGCCTGNMEGQAWWTRDGGRRWYHRTSHPPHCVDNPGTGGWYEWPPGLAPWPAFRSRICVVA
jgi:hypothetical protein